MAGQRPDQTAKGPHSIAELGGSRVPALRGSAFQHATAGRHRRHSFLSTSSVWGRTASCEIVGNTQDT